MNPHLPYPFNTPAVVTVYPLGQAPAPLILPSEEKTIENNHFLRYDFEDTSVYYSDFPGRGETRVIACPYPAYRDRVEDKTAFPLIKKTELYQLDLDNRRINCGMSYLWHLADGRFFILDGGYFTPHENERLYALLRRLQPQGPLAIAGWFFSHAHQDHFGCFIEFILKYRTEIAIDALYYTFPSLTLPEAVRFKQSDNATMREFDYTVNKILPTVKHIHPHTGDVFTLADTKIEVLFTHEDIYPEPIRSFNDTSTVLRMTVDQYSIIFLGDLHTESCRKLEAMWGKFLKADIVQVAHHGFNGSTVETYDLIAPEVALWPTAEYAYYDNLNRDVNAHLLKMDCVKEHLIAGIHKSRMLTFPYIPHTAKEIEY